LVIAGRWALFPLVWMFGIVAAVAVFGPPTRTFDAVTVTVLIVAGWGIGRLGHVTHRAAAHHALVASRSDPLTMTLNRRGFFEQARSVASECVARGQAITVLALDLDGFKAVNDREGHAAGDALLRWIGEQLPSALPPSAFAGRLGGDEFAVVLPAHEAAGGEEVAASLKRLLAPRIGVSIGLATSDGRDGFDMDRLLSEADDRMYEEKRGCSTSRAVDGMVRRDGRPTANRTSTVVPGHPHAVAAPLVDYDEVVAHLRKRSARTPEREAASLHVMNSAGTAAIVLCALAVGVATIPGSGGSWFDALGRTAALPWVLCNVALAVGSLRWPFTDAFALRWRLHYTASSVLLGAAICGGMLAGPGVGIASPVAGAMFLKIIFDRIALTETDARWSATAMFGWWAVAAVLGPASSLWVIPFQVAMFVAAWAVGRVAHHAHAEITERRVELATRDPLTGLRNRAGYEADVAKAMADHRPGPLAVLAFDLDDFKRINDERGHEAGDEILCAVAEAVRRRLPDAASIGRVGGDEFAVAIRLLHEADAAVLADDLGEVLEPIVGASVGYAVVGVDGTEPEALAQVADRRSYDAKRARRGSVAVAGGHASSFATTMPLASHSPRTSGAPRTR
jgi:diguanylate cyclase (GGDEF)-like protein